MTQKERCILGEEIIFSRIKPDTKEIFLKGRCDTKVIFMEDMGQVNAFSREDLIQRYFFLQRMYTYMHLCSQRYVTRLTSFHIVACLLWHGEHFILFTNVVLICSSNSLIFFPFRLASLRSYRIFTCLWFWFLLIKCKMDIFRMFLKT